MALIDTGTGLPNLDAFEAELEARVRRCGSGEHLMVVAIELNGFGLLNEQYGRRVGELAIRAIVQPSSIFCCAGTPVRTASVARVTGVCRHFFPYCP